MKENCDNCNLGKEEQEMVLPDCPATVTICKEGRRPPDYGIKCLSFEKKRSLSDILDKIRGKEDDDWWNLEGKTDKMNLGS